MADDERKQTNTQNRPNQAEILQEISPSELGQLRPSFTPSDQERSGMNREKARGMGDERIHDFRQNNQPALTFADTGTEDLSASARESAVHLEQNQLDSGANPQLEDREEVVAQSETNAQEQHRKLRQEEAQEAEQEQQKEQNHER